MKIGVLALQGDFAEHIVILKRLGVEAIEVRLPEQLDGLAGVIIPGGESTTMGKLADEYKLIGPLRQFAQSKAIWGTCAGAIFLSKDAHRQQPLLQLMDIAVERNAFGRQVASFEADLQVKALQLVDAVDRPYHAIFIRAPMIEKVYGKAQVLAALDNGKIVAAQEGRLMATSFHLELIDDDCFHQYFLSLAG